MTKYPLLLSLVLISSLHGMDEKKPTHKDARKQLLKRLSGLFIGQSPAKAPSVVSPSSKSDSDQGQAASPTLSDIGSPTRETGFDDFSIRQASPLPLTSPKSPRPQGPEIFLADFAEPVKKIYLKGKVRASFCQVNCDYNPENPNHVVVIARGQDATSFKTLGVTQVNETGIIACTQRDPNDFGRVEIYANHLVEVYREDQLDLLSPRTADAINQYKSREDHDDQAVPNP